MCGDDFDDLGIPDVDSSDADIFIKEDSKIKIFRSKLQKILKWSATANDMSSDYQKLYNERVKSAADVLTQISESLEGCTNIELATLKLDMDAKAFVDAFKTVGFRNRRDTSKVRLGVRERKPSKDDEVEEDEEQGAISLDALKDFHAPTESASDKIAISFVIEEKFKFLEKLGYPEIKEDTLCPVERFCAIYNRFYRRDLYVLVADDKVGESLVDYAKTDVELLDYYTESIVKLQEKGVVTNDIDFKRTAFDVRTAMNNVTRGKITAEMTSEYLFYYEYLNDLFSENKLVEKIPEVNFKTALSGHNKNRRKK